MASLKSLKERILSIRSTRKITSAMKMVASAKLHKAESRIGNMQIYSESLYHVMESLLSGDYSSHLSEDRAPNRIAIIAFSSDTALCGAFNASVFRELEKTLNTYKDKEIQLYTIGKKVYDATQKAGITVTQNFEKLAEKPDYKTIADLGELLIRQFETYKIDRVELIYHHFKSAGSQQQVHENLLPLSLPTTKESTFRTDYILEPSREELLEVLIPKSIKLKLYTALLDSNASEHAARMISMQIATDNADQLITDLTLTYNKSRQHAITSELLDIVSGSMNS